jgi:crossover junction endonuclease MUS81
MILFIDYREHWFINKIRNRLNNDLCLISDSDTDSKSDKDNDNEIEYLNQSETTNELIFTYNKENIKYKICNLPVGDFIIGDSDEIFELVIERKTISDLCSSISDGRFRQQKSRLIDSIKNPNKVMYLIENCNKKLYGKINETIINGSIINMIYKHDFNIIQSQSQDDSWNYVCMLYKKIKNNDIKIKVNDIINKTITNVAPSKLLTKREAIRDNIFANQLTIIPGISYKIALIITKEYHNANTLIKKYDELTSEKDKLELLSSIQISEKRKLGKSLSAQIYYCLCN